MRSRVVGAMVAAAILIGGYGAITGGGGGGGTVTTANIWVSAATGNDSTCTRSSTPLAFAAAAGHICASPDHAYTIASCNDDILVKGGSYGGTEYDYVSGLDSCTSSTRVKINVASGEAVTVTSNVTRGARHLYVSGSQGSWTTTGSSFNGIDIQQGSSPFYCGGTPGPIDEVFDHLTVTYVKVGCFGSSFGANSPSDITIQNSNIGPLDSCASNGSEDLVQIGGTTRTTIKGNWIHDLTQSVNGCNHSDGIQIAGPDTDPTIDGNVFSNTGDDAVLSKTDSGDIVGLWFQNNAIGGNINQRSPYQLGIFDANTHVCSGGRSNFIRDNTFAGSGTVTINCSGMAASVTNNLFDSSSKIDNGGGSCYGGGTVDFNVWQGTPLATCGTNVTSSATPNWANQNPSATVKADLHIGAGSSGIIDVGSTTSGYYVTPDADGNTRPQGGGVDSGAYEKG